MWRALSATEQERENRKLVPVSGRTEAAHPGGIAMKNLKMLLLVPAALVAVACGRGDTTKVDDALKNDLALASQAQPYNAQQVTSPTEMGYAYNPYTGQFQPVPKLTQPQSVQRVASRPTVRRTASRASSARRVVYTPAPEPIRHTKRDAAIGAV